jgi:TfoX/Sxy family transcriptional regulator of competence genes
MDSSLELMQEQIANAAASVAPECELTFRPIFGGISGYVAGRVFASLSNVGLALKLSPSEQANLLALPDAKRLRYEPDAPESKQYIVVPPSVPTDEGTFATWVGKSIEFVLTLPAPTKRVTKAKGA